MKHAHVSKVLIGSILLTSLLGQFGRFATPLGEVSLYELGMVLFCLASIPAWKRWRLSAPTLWVMGFFVWAVCITFLRGWIAQDFAYGMSAIAYLLRLALYGVFALSLHQTIKNAHVPRPWVQKAAGLWFGAQAVLGLGQYLFFPDTRILFWLGWDDHLSRAFGTLLDPAFFGLLMVLGALSALYQMLSPKEKWYVFAQFCLCFLAIVVTYSRSTYVAFVVGIVLWSWLEKQRRWLLFIPLLVGALVLVPKDGGGEGQNLGRTSTVAIREEVVQIHTRNTRWDEWLFGRGWNYEQARQLHRSATGEPVYELPGHSAGVDVTPLHILLSTGILGTGFLALAFWSAWKRQMWSHGQWSLLGAIWVHGLFAHSPLYPWVLLFQALLLQPEKRD